MARRVFAFVIVVSVLVFAYVAEAIVPTWEESLKVWRAAAFVGVVGIAALYFWPANPSKPEKQ